LADVFLKDAGLLFVGVWLKNELLNDAKIRQIYIFFISQYM